MFQINSTQDNQDIFTLEIMPNLTEEERYDRYVDKTLGPEVLELMEAMKVEQSDQAGFGLHFIR